MEEKKYIVHEKDMPKMLCIARVEFKFVKKICILYNIRSERVRKLTFFLILI